MAKPQRPPKPARLWVDRSRITAAITMQKLNPAQQSVIAAHLIQKHPNVFEIDAVQEARDVLNSVGIGWTDVKRR